jgi:IS605 OrfB family transposase
MSDIILTRKIKLGVYVPEIIVDEKERKTYKDFVWSLLRNINRQNFEFHNLLVKKLIEIDAIISSRLSVDDKFIKLKNNYFKDKKVSKPYFDYIKQTQKEYIESLSYKNINSYIYNYLVQYIKSLSDEQQLINSYSYCAISKNVCDKYNDDLFDVNRGIKNVAFYKNTQPIPINIKAPSYIDEKGVKSKSLGKFWFNKHEDKYVFKFKSSKKHDIELLLLFGKDRSNNRIMIDRIYNNDSNYKICDSDIQIIDNEIFLLLTIKQFNIENKILDKNKVLGVDLGIKCAAYIATNNSLERQQIGSKEFVLLKTKLQIEKDKRLLQRNSIFSKSGHGRTRKLQKLNDFKEYEKNFRNTFNHQISSEIISHAIKWNCGQINVEDLSAIPLEEKNKRILRNWAYFDLLNKIEYKAKKNGINFLKVNPAYTSQICNVCGKKGERIKQDTFICINQDCKFHDKPINADYNAAINIAKNINIKKEEIVSIS